MLPSLVRLDIGTRVTQRCARSTLPEILVVQLAIKVQNKDSFGRLVSSYQYTLTRPNGQFIVLPSSQVVVYKGPKTTQVSFPSSQPIVPPTMSQMLGKSIYRAEINTYAESLSSPNNSSSTALVKEMLPSASTMDTPTTKYHHYRLSGKPLPKMSGREDSDVGNFMEELDLLEKQAGEDKENVAPGGDSQPAESIKLTTFLPTLVPSKPPILSTWTEGETEVVQEENEKSTKKLEADSQSKPGEAGEHHTPELREVEKVEDIPIMVRELKDYGDDDQNEYEQESHAEWASQMSRSSSNYGKETFQDSVLIESVKDEEKESSMKVLEDPIDKQELPSDKEISRTDSFLSPLEKDFIESYAPECYPPSGDEERESSKKVWDNPTYKEELLSEKEISPTDTFGDWP